MPISNVVRHRTEGMSIKVMWMGFLLGGGG